MNESPADELPGADPAAILADYRQSVLAAEQRFRTAADPDALHDYRVALRRARTLFSLLKGRINEVRWLRLRKDFRWLSRITSTLRDIEVLDRELNSGWLQHRLTPGSAETLQVALTVRVAAERSGLLHACDSDRYRRFHDAWARAATGLQPASGTGVASKAVPVADVRRPARRIWRRLRRAIRQARPDSPFKFLHRIRKTGKQLRYLIEAFPSAFPAADAAGVLAELKSLQDALGAICDRVAQAKLLGEWSKLFAGGTPARLAAAGELKMLRRELRSVPTMGNEVANQLSAIVAGPDRSGFRALFRTPANAEKRSTGQ